MTKDDFAAWSQRQAALRHRITRQLGAPIQHSFPEAVLARQRQLLAFDEMPGQFLEAHPADEGGGANLAPHATAARCAPDRRSSSLGRSPAAGPCRRRTARSRSSPGLRRRRSALTMKISSPYSRPSLSSSRVENIPVWRGWQPLNASAASTSRAAPRTIFMHGDAGSNEVRKSMCSPDPKGVLKSAGHE